jgi:hypothetical protein
VERSDKIFLIGKRQGRPRAEPLVAGQKESSYEKDVKAVWSAAAK